jgi:hypothetical protein
MAAINCRRLQLALPSWRPLLFGFGSLAGYFLNGMTIDNYVVDLLLYLGAVALIWMYDLQPQKEVFLRECSQTVEQQASWGWPSFAGAPVAAGHLQLPGAAAASPRGEPGMPAVQQGDDGGGDAQVRDG